ncbi:helix-turn-helix domain-containing protein, partial [Bacillus sp. OTU530]
MQLAINYLGVSRSTIDRWRKDKHLPFIKIGKEILFDKNEL